MNTYRQPYFGIMLYYWLLAVFPVVNAGRTSTGAQNFNYGSAFFQI